MGYDNTNSGSLFKNDKREKETHPTHTGTIDIEGKEYWLSAWVMEVKNKDSKIFGQKFFSLRVKPKEAGGGTPSSPINNDFDPSEDIPF